MIKAFSDEAWDDYTYWETQDKKTLKRIHKLINDIDRNGYDGIGKPEQLSGDLSSYWSRRIDDKNRIVYRIKDSCFESQFPHESCNHFVSQSEQRKTSPVHLLRISRFHGSLTLTTLHDFHYV